MKKYFDNLEGVYYNVEDCSERECTIVIEAPQLGPKRPFIDFTNYLEVRFTNGAVIHLAYKFGEGWLRRLYAGLTRLRSGMSQRIRIRLVAIRNEDEEEC